MYKNNPNLVDHLNDPTSVCTSVQSEMHQNYQTPILKKPSVTRAHRLEQFLWHEFYDEYIRSKQRLEAMRPGKPTTEYFDHFSKQHLNEFGEMKEIAGEELINKFPLYATNAITLWNKQGDYTCNFRRKACITLPTSEQRGKFDD